MLLYVHTSETVSNSRGLNENKKKDQKLKWLAGGVGRGGGGGWRVAGVKGRRGRNG